MQSLNLVLLLWLLVMLLFSLPVASLESTSPEKKFEYNLEHFSYAGPMAVMQLANDWQGDLKNGKDAISFIQSEVSASYNNVHIGYLARKYHQFLIGNDLARGFYYYNNDITLAERMQINAKLEGKVYQGKGLRLGYLFHNSFESSHQSSNKRLDNQLTIMPSIVALRLDDIIWGGFEGDLYYTSNQDDDWGGTIDLDYAYSEDYVARRPLEGKTLGWLYGLDLDIAWSSPWLDAQYQGVNVFSRIYWDDLPKTRATISTESAFYLIGSEYFDDAILTAPALHYVQISAPLFSSSQNTHWVSSTQITEIRSFYYHGLQYRTQPGVLGSRSALKLGLQHDFASSTTKLSFEHESVVMELASQTIDISKSQQLVLKLGVRLLF